jgi:hypothetical protein
MTEDPNTVALLKQISKQFVDAMATLQVERALNDSMYRCLSHGARERVRRLTLLAAEQMIADALATSTAPNEATVNALMNAKDQLTRRLSALEG